MTGKTIEAMMNLNERQIDFIIAIIETPDEKAMKKLVTSMKPEDVEPLTNFINAFKQEREHT